VSRGRVAVLAGKAWSFLLDVLRQPSFIPFIAWHVAVRKVHLGELLKVIEYRRWLLGAGIGTLIDVGANKGQFASAIRALLPDVRIFAFEPVPDCHRALAEAFRADSAFSAYNVALGDGHGHLEFFQNAFTKSSSALAMTDLHVQAFPWTGSSTRIQVELRRLDDYADAVGGRGRTLLKIDTQGYELEVLKGASRTLDRIDYILVETSFVPLYEGQANFRDVYAFLTGRGFEYAGSFEQMMSPLDGTVLQADGLFVRSRP